MQPMLRRHQMNAVPHQQHFRTGGGLVVVHDCAIRLPVEANADSPLNTPLRLTEAVLQVPDLQLTMRLPATPGISASLALSAADGATLTLPDDLLAVLGWNLSRWCTMPLVGTPDYASVVANLDALAVPSRRWTAWRSIWQTPSLGAISRPACADPLAGGVAPGHPDPDTHLHLHRCVGDASF